MTAAAHENDFLQIDAISAKPINKSAKHSQKVVAFELLAYRL